MEDGKEHMIRAGVERLYADVFVLSGDDNAAGFDFSEKPFPIQNIRALDGVIGELPVNEAAVLRAAYGLKGDGLKTAAEIAADRGVEEPEIANIIKEATFRLREPNRQKKLRVLTRTHDELVAQLFGFEQRRKLLEWAVESTMEEEEE